MIYKTGLYCLLLTLTVSQLGSIYQQTNPFDSGCSSWDWVNNRCQLCYPTFTLNYQTGRCEDSSSSTGARQGSSSFPQEGSTGNSGFGSPSFPSSTTPSSQFPQNQGPASGTSNNFQDRNNFHIANGNNQVLPFLLAGGNLEDLAANILTKIK